MTRRCDVQILLKSQRMCHCVTAQGWILLRKYFSSGHLVILLLLSQEGKWINFSTAKLGWQNFSITFLIYKCWGCVSKLVVCKQGHHIHTTGVLPTSHTFSSVYWSAIKILSYVVGSAVTNISSPHFPQLLKVLFTGLFTLEPLNPGWTQPRVNQGQS